MTDRFYRVTQRIGSGVLKQPPSVQFDSFFFCIRRWCHLLSCGPAKLSQVCDAFWCMHMLYQSRHPCAALFWPIEHKALRGPLPAFCREAPYVTHSDPQHTAGAAAFWGCAVDRHCAHCRLGCVPGSFWSGGLGRVAACACGWAVGPAIWFAPVSGLANPVFMLAVCLVWLCFCSPTSRSLPVFDMWQGQFRRLWFAVCYLYEDIPPALEHVAVPSRAPTRSVPACMLRGKPQCCVTCLPCMSAVVAYSLPSFALFSFQVFSFALHAGVCWLLGCWLHDRILTCIVQAHFPACVACDFTSSDVHITLSASWHWAWWLLTQLPGMHGKCRARGAKWSGCHGLHPRGCCDVLWLTRLLL